MVAHFVTFCAQLATPDASDTLRAASLWAVVPALLCGGRPRDTLIACTLPGLACVLHANRALFMKEVYAWSIASRISGVKCVQFHLALPHRAVGFAEVRNESFFIVEHEIALQRSAIEEAARHAGRRVHKRNVRCAVAAVSFLANVAAIGLYWRVSPAHLACLCTHVVCTVAGLFTPSGMVLPDGEIGSNAALVASTSGLGGNSLLLPAYCGVVLAVTCATAPGGLSHTLGVVAVHVTATALFMRQSPALVAYALFGLSTINAVFLRS